MFTKTKLMRVGFILLTVMSFSLTVQYAELSDLDGSVGNNIIIKPTNKICNSKYNRLEQGDIALTMVLSLASHSNTRIINTSVNKVDSVVNIVCLHHK
ncbi:MAG: hypothetical protein WCX83_01420 [Candidatus Cloacimonas sp.]|nr:hypothetical protein [Candidatus Cloacimonadota bacterium]